VIGAASALLLCATGCYGPRPPLVLPAVPRPLAAINSPFDDFNAAAPDEASGALVFSTNRGSQGRQFDLWVTSLRFAENRYDVLAAPRPFEPKAMSAHDELGPAFFTTAITHNPDRGTLVFTSDRPGGIGGFDLYTWPVPALGEPAAPRPAAPVLLPGVNTAGYEGYWTYDPAALGAPAVFASDRDGRGLDAYAATPPMGASPAIARIDALSTDHDETAFFMQGTRDGYRVLFASNRPGGVGDYDLYCAEFRTTGGWQAPVPLTYASSPGRDYRPIVFQGYGRDVLIFSSDRPGGQGGMDLYYVGMRGPCLEST
jgi:WD40-like Beta Propeller Repeat